MGHHAQIKQTVKQDQKLIMGYAMQRAFKVLQMPQLELSEWLHNELEQNPVYEVTSFSSSSDLSWIRSKDTLYEYLEKEIAFHFDDLKEKEVALFIAGNLNSKGFLTLSEEEICSLQNISPTFYKHVIHQFHQIEPIGLGARGVREALLLQLAAIGKDKTPLYTLIKKYYTDLLHNRLQTIAKGMGLSIKTVKTLIDVEIKKLDPFPGRAFHHEVTREIVPDLLIEKDDDTWSVTIYGDLLPHFHIQPHYDECLKQNKLSKGEVDFIRRHLASGKWLLRTLDRRKKILTEIGSYLLKKQLNFLEGIESSPRPLTRREVAFHLGLSESTVTRATYHKYAYTPRGLIPLSSFFSHGIKTDSGLISNQAAKNLLLKLIQSENKESPLSDQVLSDQLSLKGVPCARRTVAKYRKALKIGSRHKRKKWN